MQTQAYAAHIACELGDEGRAAPLVAELLRAFEESRVGYGISVANVASWSATALGRGSELVAALGPSEFPYGRAAVRFANGDPVGAAEICAAIGARTDEAYMRLVAGRAGDAEELERALAFYRSVGATRYVRQGEALLAASA